ncbi:MAG: hypothetical protein ABGY11_02255 [Candidatus Thioglobus sp.]|jgi:hypothetical protein
MGEYNPRVTSSGMLTGDTDALKRYQDIAEYYNLTPDQMMFGQDTSVVINPGYKEDNPIAKKYTTGTSAYNQTHNNKKPHAAKIDYWNRGGDFPDFDFFGDTAHEFPHILSKHLAAMDETGGMLKKTAKWDSPDYGITGYGRHEAKKYLNDFDSFSNPEDRFNFFKDRVMNNQSFKMRPDLKDKVSSAVANIQIDPVQRKRTDIMIDKGDRGVEYYARPEEVWARSMGAYGEIEKLMSKGGRLIESTNKGSYSGIKRLFHQDEEGKWSNFKINKKTYDSIKDMINEFKRHKYTISKSDTAKKETVV